MHPSPEFSVGIEFTGFFLLSLSQLKGIKMAVDHAYFTLNRCDDASYK